MYFVESRLRAIIDRTVVSFNLNRILYRVLTKGKRRRKKTPEIIIFIYNVFDRCALEK
jgi:hypothetical protein